MLEKSANFKTRKFLNYPESFLYCLYSNIDDSVWIKSLPPPFLLTCKTHNTPFLSSLSLEILTKMVSKYILKRNRSMPSFTSSFTRHFFCYQTQFKCECFLNLPGQDYIYSTYVGTDFYLSSIQFKLF